MATALPNIDTIPHHAGIGRMRRFAAAVLEHAHPEVEQRVHLRGALPLRSPGDAAGLDHDPLTGLASQPVFVAALERWAAQGGRDGSTFSLVLLDLDHLGYVNGRHGHVQGDRLLRETAEAMRQRASHKDRLFRIGGDEFAMLLAGTGPEDARRRTEAILQALELPADDAPAGSASAGIAGAPWSATGPGDLYLQAAAALADVKRRGGAGAVAFDPGRHSLTARPATSGGDLVERVVGERLLRPVYQPIVDLRSGTVLGFEGLVRVHDPASQVGTSELFAAASSSDRVVELDLACIDAVVAGAREMRSDRLLTLNLSPRTLAGGKFDPAWLHQRLVRAGISPGRVIVELSDDKRVDDLGRLQASFLELQRLGLRLAADDVSRDDPVTRLMTHLPFDIVKIDLTRLWEGAQTGPQLALLRDVARSRRAHVVAEGVETAEQLVAVRDLEFGAGQGFLLGRPDADVVEAVLDLERLESGDVSHEAGAAQEPPPVDESWATEIPAERLALFLPPTKPAADVEIGAA